MNAEFFQTVPERPSQSSSDVERRRARMDDAEIQPVGISQPRRGAGLHEFPRDRRYNISNLRPFELRGTGQIRRLVVEISQAQTCLRARLDQYSGVEPERPIGSSNFDIAVGLAGEVWTLAAKVGNRRDNYASPEQLSARGTAPWPRAVVRPLGSGHLRLAKLTSNIRDLTINLRAHSIQFI